MAREWTTPMEWQNEGTEPSTELKKTGYVGKDKPAAPTFNYFLHKQQLCIEEVQKAVDEESAKLTNHISTNAGKRFSNGGEVFNDYENNAVDTIGDYAHIQGSMCAADGDYADSGGVSNFALGYASFTRGQCCGADGSFSSAMGLGLMAIGEAQTVLGKYNTENTDALLIVGYGSSDGFSENRANALRVSNAGRCYGAGAFLASGADYAEMFEWIDGNPNNEDRRGLFVVLDGEKIRLANENDRDNIFGVISANPSVVGDVRSEEWHGKYKKDVFGADIWEEVEVAERKLKNGKVIPAHIEKQRVLNPDYDPNQKYLSRDERKEWATVGIIGKLIMIDDGTCEVNGYCTVSKNGIATKVEDKTAYRVMSRIDDTHIQVFIK